MINKQYDAIVRFCPKCNGRGIVLDKDVKLKFGRPTDDIVGFLQKNDLYKPCICQNKFARILSLLEANIPENLWTANYKNVVLEDYDVVDCSFDRKVKIKYITDKYTKEFEDARKRGYGFVFFGPNGTGKTLFGCRMLIRALRKGYSAHYIFFADLIDMLKEFDDDFVYSVIDEIYNVDFLFIDELGKEVKTSSFVLSNFERMLKNRVSRKQPTIFAMNLSIDDMRQKYGGAIMSLVEANNLILSFHGVNDLRVRDGKTGLRTFFGA